MFSLDAVVLYLDRARGVLPGRARRAGLPCQANFAHCWDLSLLYKQKQALCPDLQPSGNEEEGGWSRVPGEAGAGPGDQPFPRLQAIGFLSLCPLSGTGFEQPNKTHSIKPWCLG